MKTRSLLVKAFVIILVPMIVSLLPARGSASGPEEDLSVISFEQRDLNGDGAPDMAILMTSYMGERNRVVICDQGLDMQRSNDWRLGTDFVNDLWLFQTETGDQTKLIIRFSHDVDSYKAELFDDSNRDKTVSYNMRDNCHVDITESSFPTIEMKAEEPWVLPDGRVNYMVRLDVYRQLPGPFVTLADVSVLPAPGELSHEYEIVDSDGDQIPNYELIRAFPDVTTNLFPTFINTNISGRSRPNFEGSFLWPYLEFTDPEEWSGNFARRPENNSPPIKFDSRDGQIKGALSFLPLWGLGDQWLILSRKEVEKHRTNDLDWEVFANYDFNNDTTMDMILRNVYHPVQTVRIGDRELYLHQVGYHWHHQNLNTLQWDYKLEMAGLHELPNSVVEFPDFAVRAVPFYDLLSRFTRQDDWAFATFVANEGGAGDSNEGIWEWGTLEGVLTDVTLQTYVPDSFQAQRYYLYGRVDTSPSGYYSRIRKGLRGEYADLNGPAMLYFSPVDRKLHLQNAKTGAWTLSDTDEIRYKNLDDDAYIDQWTYTHVVTGTQPVTVTKQLMATKDHLIYSWDDSVMIKQVSVMPSLFETVPPRNAEEWAALGGELTASRRDFASDDFAGMIAQFDGPEMRIVGARLQDYRPTEGDGFRFVLELQPNARINGSGGPELRNRPPGAYVVTYASGTFEVEPAAPPEISLHLQPAASAMPSANSVPPTLVRAINSGLIDARGLTLAVQAHDGENTREVMTTALDVLVGKPAETTIDWQPAESWTWQLDVQLRDQHGALVAEASAPLESVSSTSARNRMIPTGLDSSRLILISVILGLGVLLATSAFVLNWLRKENAGWLHGESDKS